MNKSSIILSAGVLILAVAMIFLTTYKFDKVDAVSNVSYEGNQQIIAITAKGGFSPSNTVAKAGMPTTLKITTNGTFDCSSSLVIPSLNYEKLLPTTGLTEVEIPAQEKGKTINGMCSMGMYNFSLKFE
jgi:uncharacterized protein